MIEKVNPSHPDKVADRIAGAIVDLAYSKVENPKIAVKVLLGHGEASLIMESSVEITQDEVERIVNRITGRNDLKVSLLMVSQDPILVHNKNGEIRCGDNGIPLTDEENLFSQIANDIFLPGFLTESYTPRLGTRLVNTYSASLISRCLHNKNCSKKDVPMSRFDIDITPVINGEECHLEGFCEIISSDTFRVTMTSPFAGLSVTKTFEDIGSMDICSTFALVEKDLTELYINRIHEDAR